MEQGNQLLEQASDANDSVRDHNKKSTQDYHNKVQTNKEMAEGEEWYHGVTDALGAQHTYQALSQTSARMGEKGLSGIGGYGKLALSDTGDAGKALVGAGADLASATANTVKGTVSSLGAGLQKAGQVGKNVVGSVQKLTGVAQPVERAGQTSAQVASDLASKTPSGFVAGNVESSADLTTNVGKTAESTTSAVATGAEGGAKATGGLLAKGIAAATGGYAEVGSIANVGLGKSLGNIGGAIDIVKDFGNIGKAGGFFGGTGASKGDELSNALTVGGSVLDIASLALPFLAPIAAGVQIAGAIDGTVQSVKDNEAKSQTTKGRPS